jgi:hypothetical protein
MQWGKSQGLRGVVEAFAAGAIGRQRVTGVNFDLEEVADGGGVFVATEAAKGVPAGRKTVLARGSAECGSGEADKCIDVVTRRSGPSLGRHFAVANAKNRAVPGVGVGGERLGLSELVDGESARRARCRRGTSGSAV